MSPSVSDPTIIDDAVAALPVQDADEPVVSWFSVGKVQFAKFPDAGVPSAGVTNIGLVNVLFVRVSVVSAPTSVVDAAGNVMVFVFPASWYRVAIIGVVSVLFVIVCVFVVPTIAPVAPCVSVSASWVFKSATICAALTSNLLTIATLTVSPDGEESKVCGFVYAMLLPH
jgi:hypothetical protein